MAKTKVSAKKLEQFSAAVDKAARETSTFVDLWNRITGVGGTVQLLFPDRSERTAFMQSDEWKRYQDLVSERMGGSQEKMLQGMPDASGNLSVRLPRSLHAALKLEADEEGVSINQLIVAKLSVQLRTAVSS